MTAKQKKPGAVPVRSSGGTLYVRGVTEELGTALEAMAQDDALPGRRQSVNQKVLEILWDAVRAYRKRRA